MIKNKGQGWAFDVMIASTIFVTALLLLFVYSINYKTESDEILNALTYDGNAAADLLLSEGYPIDWTTSNVIVPGILTEKRINETKINRFNALSPEKKKSLINTRYDFCFELDESSCHGIAYNSEAENLVLISRITIYQNQPSLFKLYIWQE